MIREEKLYCYCGYTTLLKVMGDYYPFKVYFQCRSCNSRIKKNKLKKA